MRHTVKNAKGEPVVLNRREQSYAELLSLQMNSISNALGYEIDMTSLSTILKSVTEQKFYEIPFAEYFAVRAGEGAWSSNLIKYRSFDVVDSFATGVVNTSAGNGRVAQAGAGVDSIPVAINNWAKEIVYTLFDLNQAAKSGNWDLVTTLEKARKRNWDLGLQEVAFLGLNGNSACNGLLTLPGITTNTAIIPQPLKTLSPTDLSAFCQNAYEAYRDNCSRTAKPNRFVIPESDWNGLAAQASPQFPMKTIKDLIEEAFKTISGDPSFQMMPCAYGDAAHNSLGLQKYSLHNTNEDSLAMNIPVDYTNTLANSLNNYSFQSVGLGQFTGAVAYRPSEVLYFTHTL